MKYGERNFRIISANIDNLRNYETMKELDMRMENKKADMVCIQETHNNTDMERKFGNYNFLFPKSKWRK